MIVPQTMPYEPNDDDLHDNIARIETRIEELREALDRCVKLSLAAKIAIGAGLAWLVLALIGLAPSIFSIAVAAMAAAIGGVVLLGSNATTWAQTEERLRASEAMRASLIERLDLRVVDEGVRRLH
jgi:hypothetical protein